MRLIAPVVVCLIVSLDVGAQQVDSSRVAVWAEILGRARKAQQVHNERLALVLYDSVIALDPRNSMAYFQRAMVHHNLGDSAASRADLRKSEQLGNPQATFFLSGEGKSMLDSVPATGASDDLMRAEELNRTGMAKLASGDTNPIRHELLLLLAIAVILSIPLALWVHLTPQGIVSDDEVAPGEVVLWSGAPRQGYYVAPILASSLIFGVLLFGMLFFGFQFRLARVIERRDPFEFLLILYAAGVWSMVGRYFKSVRQRKQTTYILTEKRALITRGSYIIEHKLDSLGTIQVSPHADGTASLSGASVELFEHVADGERIKTLIEDARLRTRGVQ